MEQPPASWRPVPSSDGFARRGHIEHPVELYTITKPLPNTMATPDGADEWIEDFGLVLAPGNLPGGDGKTSSTLPVDTDPPGNADEWIGGPGLDLCRACIAPVNEFSPECAHPFNHQGRA
ncbi:hypothetical protein AB0N56_30410 [Streptomyces microflavus]|uniref:hypothetical protein n=1 Tax=Streptomyces microflavus TaxID=1919 RepID=UPI0034264C28